MIPDEPFNFNHVDAISNFADADVRLRQLHPRSVITLRHADRYQLFVCPVCKHPWYKAGRYEYPRLTAEQLGFLAAALHVDIHALYLLPRAVCTVCSTCHLGGMFSAEAYAKHVGYRLLWESASPRRIQLLALVCRAEALTLDTLVRMIPGTVGVRMSDVLSVLAWLENCPFSEAINALSDEQSQQLAQLCPPGYAMSRQRNQWHGYAWNAACPPLGGDALIVLAVAFSARTLPTFDSLCLGWRVLAQAMRMVL